MYFVKHKVKKQRDLIKESNWDILLVIDACRFDYFKKYYKEILGNVGNLQKTLSPSTFTIGWLIDLFNEKKENVIFICSESVSNKIKDISKKLKHGKDYDINSCFDKIVDVWKDNYDAENDTVWPDAVTNTTIKIVKENPNKKIITKYWQVHEPYLYYMNKGEVNIPLKPFLRGVWRKLLYEVISDETYWTIINKLNLPQGSWHGYIWLKYGREGIINGYVNDLKMMLGHVKKIMKFFPNKNIVVTSDHGERLGEWGRYSHGGRRNKIIKEVPWLEIKRR